MYTQYENALDVGEYGFELAWLDGDLDVVTAAPPPSTIKSGGAISVATGGGRNAKFGRAVSAASGGGYRPSLFLPTVIADGPRQHYRLGDSGSTAVDIAGGYNGTYQGTVSHPAGGVVNDPDKAADFSASGYVSIPGTAPDYHQSPVTCEAWVKFNPANGSAQFIYAGYSAVSSQGWGFVYQPLSAGHQLGYYSFDYGIWLEMGSAINDTNEHQVVVTVSPSGWVRFFIDGKFNIASGSLPPGAYSGVKTIGAANDGSNAGTLPFADEVILFDYELSAVRILEHYLKFIGSNAKTGQGTSGASGGGSKSAGGISSRAGGAVAVGSGGAPKTVFAAKSGGATSPASGGATRTIRAAKASGAISIASGGATKASVNVRSGGATSPASGGGVGFAFPLTGVLDNFNRADENPIAGLWSGPVKTLPLLLVGNQASSSAPQGTLGASYYNGQLAADMEAFVTVAVAPVSPNRTGVYVRVQNPGGTYGGYLFAYRASINGFQFIRDDNATFTILGANVTQTVSAGDSIGLRIVGSTLTGFYKPAGGAWTVIGQRTDSTYSGPGYIGLATSDTASRLDDFGGTRGVISIAKSGGATAIASASGNQAIRVARSSGAISISSGGATRATRAAKSNGAVSPASAGAVRSFLRAEASGAFSVASGGGSKAVRASKSAGGLSPASGGASKAARFVKTAVGAISPASGGGSKLVVTGFTKPGGSVVISRGGATKVVTFVKLASGAISPASGGASKALRQGRLGGAVSIASGSATKVFRTAKTSGAISIATGGGAQREFAGRFGGGLATATAGGDVVIDRGTPAGTESGLISAGGITAELLSAGINGIVVLSGVTTTSIVATSEKAVLLSASEDGGDSKLLSAK
jgi:hypothetical protein